MTISFRHVSPALFGFVLLCFLLPFVTVSCPGASHSFSGLNLATGTTIEEPSLFGQAPTKKRLPSEPLALFAALVAIGGLLFALKRPAGPAIVVTILGVLGAVLLLVLKFKLDRDVVRQGQGMLTLNYGLGYGLAILGFLAAATSRFVLPHLASRSPASPLPAQPPPTDSNGLGPS